jgi:hypothetical protein
MSPRQPSRPWPMARQLVLAFGMVLVLLAAVAGLGAWMLRDTLSDMHSLYVDRVEPLEQLGTVRFLATRDRVLVMDAILRAQPENTAKRLKEFNANRESSARTVEGLHGHLPDRRGEGAGQDRRSRAWPPSWTARCNRRRGPWPRATMAKRARSWTPGSAP